MNNKVPTELLDELGLDGSDGVLYAMIMPERFGVYHMEGQRPVLLRVEGKMEFFDPDGVVLFEMNESNWESTNSDDIDLLLSMAWGEAVVEELHITLDAVMSVFDGAGGSVGDDG